MIFFNLSEFSEKTIIHKIYSDFSCYYNDYNAE